jgi:predicted ATPase/class 3 adenylate cyclase
MKTINDPNPEPIPSPTAPSDRTQTSASVPSDLRPPTSDPVPPASRNVSFLFTDLEGSTRFWEHRPDVMPAVYARHDAILRAAVAEHEGTVYKVIGDAFQIAFPTAAGALLAAVAAQRALLREPWPLFPAPRVRMALHACAVAPDADGDYRTPGLNRLGRLLTAADGGEILASETIARDLADRLPPHVRLHDLGGHRFRDLSAQRVYQVFAPGLPEEPSRLRGLAQHRHNLPPQPTAFIGREAEVRRVQVELGDSAVRVLTLTGPGGIGKTRLALASAEGMVDRFADGVWFVPLAAVSEPDLVPPAIARVFGVRESVGQSLLEAIVAHLAERESLLVLDNLEQVLGTGPAVAALVAGCPRLTVLATSRTPLGIAGERILTVPALAVPDLARERDLARLAESDAVRLFADRARLVRPNFAIDAENVGAVAAICRRLDGLPLAIELAAARSRLLTPAQLLPKLEDRLALLTGGARDLPTRQQTLRAAIDWSHDLLEPAEQALFARLGVFAGGASLDAIEAVCADPADGDLDLFDRVESLARQSLLEVDEDAPAPRVRMLETIRDYARDRLAQRGETDTVAARHAAHFLELAERAQEPLAGPEQADWLDLLALEHDNLRAALDHFARSGSGVDGVRLAGALWQFWWIRGHLGEGRGRLRRALERVERDRVPPAVLARALDGAGVLAEAQGDVEHGVALHAEALMLWEEAGNRLGQARSHNNLGLIELHDRGNLLLAQEHFERALALYREEGDRPGIAAALHNLGDAALSAERFADASALYEESLAHAKRLDNTRAVAAGLTSLGALAFFQGDHARAIRFYEESLPLWRQLADVPGTALVLGNLGEALDHAGDVLRARQLYDECLDLSRELGDRQGIAFATSHLARLARRDGDPRHAAHLFAESAGICDEIGDAARLAEAIEGMAGALSDLDAAADAARLFGAAGALRQRTDSPLLAVHFPAYERDRNAVRTALGPAGFDALLAEGATTEPATIRTIIASADHDRQFQIPAEPGALPGRPSRVGPSPIAMGEGEG